MKQYKPEYLGKVLPDDKLEMSNFMHNKYEGFSKVYDACKSESEKITDIQSVKSDNDKSYTVKISADADTIKNISNNNTDCSVKINGDMITTE